MFSEKHQKGLFTFYWEQQELQNQIKWKNQHKTLETHENPQQENKNKSTKNVIHEHRKKLQQLKIPKNYTEEQQPYLQLFDRKEIGSSVVVVCRKENKNYELQNFQKKEDNENKEGKSNSARCFLECKRVALDLKKFQIQKIPIEQYRKIQRNDLKLRNMNKYRQKKQEERKIQKNAQFEDKNVLDVVLPKIKKKPKKIMKSENSFLRKEIQPISERKKIEFNFDNIRANSEEIAQSFRLKLNLKEKKLMRMERQRL